MYMLIRVFPFCGTTAPCLALLKSYSFFITLSFSLCSRTSRYQSDILAAIGINDYKNATNGVHSDGYKTLFIYRIFIFLSKCVGIIKHYFSIRKAYTMFFKIYSCFLWIPDDIHFYGIYI